VPFFRGGPLSGRGAGVPPRCPPVASAPRLGVKHRTGLHMAYFFPFFFQMSWWQWCYGGGGGNGGGGGDGGGSGGGRGGGEGDTALDQKKATLKVALRDERQIFNTLKARVIRLQEHTTAATIDHEVASGLLPELAALLNESQARLAKLNAEVLHLTQPDTPSTPFRSTRGRRAVPVDAPSRSTRRPGRRAVPVDAPSRSTRRSGRRAVPVDAPFRSARPPVDVGRGAPAHAGLHARWKVTCEDAGGGAQSIH
jgi:hypothetical protein